MVFMFVRMRQGLYMGVPQGALTPYMHPSKSHRKMGTPRFAKSLKSMRTGTVYQKALPLGHSNTKY